jgi:hypothetical protein
MIETVEVLCNDLKLKVEFAAEKLKSNHNYQ